MFKLLNKVHDKAEELKGRRLYVFLTITFAIFLVAGLTLGYFTDKILTKNEMADKNKESKSKEAQDIKTLYDGKVMFVDPNLYPLDKISYVLVNNKGEEIILLKTTDQKLSVAEGHYVSVQGTPQKLKDGTKNVLIVEKVILKNGAN